MPEPRNLCTCGAWKDDPVHPADHEFTQLRPFAVSMRHRRLAHMDVYSQGWDDGYSQAERDLNTWDADGGPGVFTVDT